MPYTIPDETHSAQGLAHSDLAEPKSRDFEALAQRDTGVVSGCVVTAQSTPDMTLAVASGVVRISGVDHAVTAGNVTITANATAQPRYDDVVVNTSGTKSVVAGTAASEATLDDPTIDFTLFCWLAKVYVPAGVTAITATEFVSKAIPQNPNANHDKAHAADHATGGPDAISPGSIGASTVALGSTPSTQAFGDAAAGGSGTTASKNDHKHGMPSLVTNTITLAAAAGGGTSTSAARSDAVIAAFDATNPSTQAFGDAAAVGSVAFAARRDHKHAMPAAPAAERAAASSTPAAIGTAAVGTGTTDARDDHVHATGAGTPSTQAFGDAAATGSGPAAAMTDHKHAMPSNPTGLSLGMAGATVATRYAGGTASAAPTTGTFAVGDFVITQTGKVYICTVAGTPGTWVLSGGGSGGIATDSFWTAAGQTAMASASGAAGPVSGAHPGNKGTLPTSAIAENFSRYIPLTGNALATGTMRMVLIWLPTCTVTSLSFSTSTVALALGTSPHLWAALYQADLTFLKQSTDDTAATWAASTVKTFTLSSTQAVTAGWYYVGILCAQTGGTMPTLQCATSIATTGAGIQAPMPSAVSSTGLGATAPAPAGALSGAANAPYCYVS